MIESLEIFTKPSCIFCTNLKVIINKLINNGLITCKVSYFTGKPNESVPYIIKYKSNQPPQTLYGLPIKDKLFRFLEIYDNENTSAIYPNTVKKNRKLFKTD